MDNYQKLATAIVKRQETIVGPLALVEADKVAGLDLENEDIVLDGDGKSILEALVHQYEKLFGLASVEACKDAVRPTLKDMKGVELPEILL